MTALPFGLLRAGLINFVWINVSEVFRYFAFVMPMMRAAFPERGDVALMSVGIFAAWGVWDLVLIIATTGFTWLFLKQFGVTWRNAVLAGVSLWSAIFVILWLGLFNMGLAPISVIAVALPLALVEMVVAALIVRWSMSIVRVQSAHAR